jgi:hypothetical protein
MRLFYVFSSFIISAVFVRVEFPRMVGLLASNEWVRIGKEVQFRDVLVGSEKPHENFSRIAGLSSGTLALTNSLRSLRNANHSWLISEISGL